MMSSRTRMTRTKRACDGCQIRKVKCDGGQPCQSCAQSEIACTFFRTVHVRGPRRMRETTRNIIERTQRDERRQQPSDNISLESASPDDDPTTVMQRTWKRTPVGTLAPPLYIYHVRMFPVWPVVDVDNLIAKLQQQEQEDQDGHDTLDAYALATSIVAATIAQLRLEQQTESENNACMLQASDMVSECEKACSLIRYKARINLNTVRISFFLHIYYENQQPGCGESLLHLREAISVAQLMSLHQERSYAGLAAEEQNLRRWILWLLFVTERGVCLLHKMPVIIKTNIALPSISWHDDNPSVLPAFTQLISLFWTFEQSGLFDVIRDRDNTDFSSVVGATTASLDSQTIEALHRKLHEVAKDLDSVSDVQKVDIYVTRHWMKMILWKLRSPSSSFSNDMSVAFPFNAALDFLNTVSRLPTSAIEAHGLTMQLKIVEIASSVVDSISHLATLSIALPTWTNDLSPSRILTRLHLLMSSFRYKKAACKSLVDLLYQKTAEVHARTSYCPPLSGAILGNINDEDGDDITDQRHNSSLAFGDDLSMESSLLPYNQYTGVEELGDLFDQRIDQDIMCPSQQRLGSSTSNPLFSLLVRNNEESIFISAPFTPNSYERSNETPAETLF